MEDNIKEIQETLMRNNAYYYKCDSRNKFFKSEIINDLTKILNKVGDK